MVVDDQEAVAPLTTKTEALIITVFPTNRQMLLARMHFGDHLKYDCSPLAEHMPSLLVRQGPDVHPWLVCPQLSF